MCKYCKGYFKWDEQIGDHINDLELQFNGTTIAYAYTCMEYYNASVGPVLNLIIDDPHGKIISENRVKIQYCPYCGTKLID